MGCLLPHVSECQMQDQLWYVGVHCLNMWLKSHHLAAHDLTVPVNLRFTISWR